MIEATTAQWALMVAGAVVAGIAKTALPGAGTLAVALFATALPARESTGTLLLLFIAGDLVATWTYRHDVDWGVLRRLMLPVLGGLAAGGVFLALADDVVMRRAIGVILLVLTALTCWTMWRGKLLPEAVLTNQGIRVLTGTMGGFTTMAANAGGPVMSLYFVAAQFDVVRFLATQAWFFFAVNLMKLPVSISLGLIRPEHLPRLAVLAPVVIVAALVGRVVAPRIPKRAFQAAVLVLTVVSSVYLLR